jgi:hypothetical protein
MAPKQSRAAVVQPADDLLDVLQVPAHDGHTVYFEPLIGQVVDQPFGVGIVIESRDDLASGLVRPHRRGFYR